MDLDRKLVFSYIIETKLPPDTYLVFQLSKNPLYNMKIIVMMVHKSKQLCKRHKRFQRKRMVHLTVFNLGRLEMVPNAIKVNSLERKNNREEHKKQ